MGVIKEREALARVNGDLLRQLIKDNFDSQAEFAKQVNLSPSFINRLVNNNADCSIKTLSRIAKQFGVSVKLLIKED